MHRFAVYLACFLLKCPLDIKDRLKLTGTILDKLGAAPLKNVIRVRGDGTLFINDMPVDFEKARSLQISAKALLDNHARQVVCQQVASIAGERGITQADTPEKMYFYRAALWFLLTEEEYYKTLAGELE